MEAETGRGTHRRSPNVGCIDPNIFTPLRHVQLNTARKESEVLFWNSVRATQIAPPGFSFCLFDEGGGLIIHLAAVNGVPCCGVQAL